jgi:hypothetical protein
MLYS